MQRLQILHPVHKTNLLKKYKIQYKSSQIMNVAEKEQKKPQNMMSHDPLPLLLRMPLIILEWNQCERANCQHYHQ